MNKLIIALDNMNKNEVINFIKNILEEDIIEHQKIIFKVNDLLADI
jgi:orotidine-5'-phosphate decarboxylase